MKVTMYLQNKYTHWYNNIVGIAKSRQIDGYYEKHHIVPKSLNGNDSKDNIVKLTAREHFVCHWLLTKMLPDGVNKWKMMYAFNSFNRVNKNQNRYVPNSKQYEIMKKLASEARSKLNKGNTFAKGYKRSAETIDKWRESHKGFKHSTESKEKHSLTMKEKYKTTDYIHKGKTYEEIYGVEEAQRRREKLRGKRGPRKTSSSTLS